MWERNYAKASSQSKLHMVVSEAQTQTTLQLWAKVGTESMWYLKMKPGIIEQAGLLANQDPVCIIGTRDLFPHHRPLCLPGVMSRSWGKATRAHRECEHLSEVCSAAQMVVLHKMPGAQPGPNGTRL